MTPPTPPRGWATRNASAGLSLVVDPLADLASWLDEHPDAELPDEVIRDARRYARALRRHADTLDLLTN